MVSGGELFTAVNAGFSMKKVYFHGNNKSPDELEMAVTFGVGRVVVDNFQELKTLNQICQRLKAKQEILLRITRGRRIPTVYQNRTDRFQIRLHPAGW